MIKRLVSAALCFTVVLSTVTSAFAADKLQVVTYFGGADGHKTAYERLLKSFEASKKISVENNSAQASEAWNQSILTDFNTGNEPDVLVFYTGATANDILDKVVPVATIKAAYPDYAKDITANAMTAASALNGVSYAVPFSGYWEGLFINKDMFDRARLAYPTNWDNFIKAIKYFASSNTGKGIVPISVPFAEEPHYLIEHLILSAGGPEEHDTKFGTDISKVPESWYKGLDMIKTLADMGAFGNMKAATTKRENATRNEFNQQRAAMVIHGNWLNGSINNANRGNSVQVFPFPTMPGGKSSGSDMLAGYSSGWYITKKAWNDPETQKQAVELVKYMTSKEAIKAIIQPGAAPAANVAISGGTLAARSGVAAVNNAKAISMPTNDAGILLPAAWTEVWNGAREIANGKMTAAQLLQKAVPLNK